MRSLLALGTVVLADVALVARESLLALSPQGLQGTARRNAEVALRDDRRRSSERALVEGRLDRIRREGAAVGEERFAVAR